MPRILLLGGAGKLGLQLTKLLLARGPSYQVTSVIEAYRQKKKVIAAAKDQPGVCKIMVMDMEEGLKHEKQAEIIIGESGADWVVWSVGEGFRREHGVWE